MAPASANHITDLEHKKAFIKFFFDKCRERGVHAIVIAGDLYDKTITVGDGVFNELVEILRTAPAPIYTIQGTTNHDRPGSLDFLGKLDAENYYPIYTYRRPISFPIYLDEERYHRPVLLPGTLGYMDQEYPGPNNACAWISMLPTPETGFLAGEFGTSLAEVGDRYQELVADILRGFGAQAQLTPHILISHLEAKGAVAATGQTLKSKEAIPVAAILDAKPTVTMLGHIHKAQQPALEGNNIYYCGIPYPKDLGDLGPHGFRFFTFEDGGVDMEFIPTPIEIARPIQPIAVKFENGDFTWSDEPAPGVEIQVKVYAPKDYLTDTLKSEIQKRCDGALNVTVKFVPKIETSIEDPEIMERETFTDQFESWAKSKNITITEGMHEKLILIDKEVAA